MNVVSRIFTSDNDYQRAVRQLVSLGVPHQEINVLKADVISELTESAESDAAVFVLPGVGRISANGDRAKALLRVAGGRSKAGRDSGLPGVGVGYEGLPLDDFFVFEDSLRKHRSVLFVYAPKQHQRETIEASLTQSEGQDLRQAREEWWEGVCEEEERAVATCGATHDVDDYLFRLGFEVALHPQRRGKTLEEAHRDLARAYPEACDVEAFRSGYARGRAYQQALEQASVSVTERG